MHAHRLARVLDGVTIALLVLVVWLYAWPVHVTIPIRTDASTIAAQHIAAPDIAVPALSTDATADLASGEGEAQSVASANILSSSRRAPAARYISPDQLPAPDYEGAAAAPGVFAPQSASGRDDGNGSATGDELPALYGIIHMDGVARALLRLSEEEAVPVLLREGERHGAYRVISIRADAVVVAGPSRTHTLRLVRPADRDSNRTHVPLHP